MGKEINDQEWSRGVPDPKYMAFLKRARKRHQRNEATTVRDIKAVFNRVAEQLRDEIRDIAPGSVRERHRRSLLDMAERAAASINEQGLAALHSGVILSSRAATDGAAAYMTKLSRGVFNQAEVAGLFQSINQRAVLSTMAKTRHGDGLRISDRIWNTSRKARTAIGKLVEDAVAKGTPARDLARQVSQYLQPGVFTPLKEQTRARLGVPKDISMEAMRLAVTELNHAFHESTILSYQSIPGYMGIWWRLSHTHAIIDICDEYASHGGDGFWPSGEEPSKPHPWCRCPVVPRMGEPDEMVQRLKEWMDDPGKDPEIETWYRDKASKFLAKPGQIDQIKAAAIAPIAAAAPDADPPEPEWIGQVKAEIAKGINTDADLIRIGKTIDDQLYSAVSNLEDQYSQLDQVTQQIERELAEAQDERRANSLLAKWDKLSNQKLAIYDKISANKGDLLRDMIAEIRPLGNKAQQPWSSGSSYQVQDYVKHVSRYLPSEWLERSNTAPMRGLMSTRGYYRDAVGAPDNPYHKPAELSLSPVWPEKTAIHEMGHRFEDLVPRIKELESKFYKRRTFGWDLKWLGPPYKRHEKARFDHFVKTYMGKEYDDGSFEILSMGLESIFLNSVDLGPDPEFRHFIIGMVAAL